MSRRSKHLEMNTSQLYIAWIFFFKSDAGYYLNLASFKSISLAALYEFILHFDDDIEHNVFLPACVSRRSPFLAFGRVSVCVFVLYIAFL
jgi:hypothetical protein